MKSQLTARVVDSSVGLLAVLVGAGIVYLGDRILGVRLEHFFGVQTFSPVWVVDLFVVPFVAGVAVSAIYGLGGKIWAHASPVIVRVASYYELSREGAVLPDGVTLLPISYWLLIVIVAAEFAAFGGVVGEILVKRTYGRTPEDRLYRLHRKYRKEGPSKPRVEELDR
jgi:hypothetical protein